MENKPTAETFNPAEKPGIKTTLIAIAAKTVRLVFKELKVTQSETKSEQYKTEKAKLEQVLSYDPKKELDRPIGIITHSNTLSELTNDIIINIRSKFESLRAIDTHTTQIFTFGPQLKVNEIDEVHKLLPEEIIDIKTAESIISAVDVHGGYEGLIATSVKYENINIWIRNISLSALAIYSNIGSLEEASDIELNRINKIENTLIALRRNGTGGGDMNIKLDNVNLALLTISYLRGRKEEIGKHKGYTLQQKYQTMSALLMSGGITANHHDLSRIALEQYRANDFMSLRRGVWENHGLLDALASREILDKFIEIIKVTRDLVELNLAPDPENTEIFFATSARYLENLVQFIPSLENKSTSDFIDLSQVYYRNKIKEPEAILILRIWQSSRSLLANYHRIYISEEDRERFIRPIIGKVADTEVNPSHTRVDNFLKNISMLDALTPQEKLKVLALVMSNVTVGLVDISGQLIDEMAVELNTLEIEALNIHEQAIYDVIKLWFTTYGMITLHSRLVAHGIPESLLRS